jgi:hypothetical protein
MEADADAPDLARLKRYFTESEQLTFAARSNSLRAIDYYDSDQFDREELLKLSERGQPAIVINRIKPAINGIIGVTERARSDPRAWPRNPGNEDAADAATDILRYIADFNRFRPPRWAGPAIVGAGNQPKDLSPYWGASEPH